MQVVEFDKKKKKQISYYLQIVKLVECTSSSNTTCKNIPLFDNNPAWTAPIITFYCPRDPHATFDADINTAKVGRHLFCFITFIDFTSRSVGPN
jgi:hypothetical protein